MITLKENIASALAGVCGAVVFGYPKDFATLPLLSWRESGSRRHAQADGEEYLAELEYTIDCFAPTPEEVSALLASADKRLQGMGLRREAAAEVFDPDSAVCHAVARYRALADAQRNIYQ